MKKLLIGTLLYSTMLATSVDPHFIPKIDSTYPSFAPQYGYDKPYYAPHNGYVVRVPVHRHNAAFYKFPDVISIPQSPVASLNRNQLLPVPMQLTYTQNGGLIDDDIGQAAQMLIKVQAIYTVHHVVPSQKSVDTAITTQRPFHSIKATRKAKLAKSIVANKFQQQNMPEPNVTEEQEYVAIPDATENQELTSSSMDIETVATPKKSRIYCPYCDIRFDNYPAALQHAHTYDHIRAKQCSGLDPEEQLAGFSLRKTVS